MTTPTRIGFVGAGGIAKAHADALSRVENAHIVAVTDANPEAATALAEPLSATVYSSAVEMVADAGIDALFILLPPFAHGEAEGAALSAGIPFFIEKPVGLDMGRLAEIAAEVERKDLMTSAAYMNRYREPVNRVREVFQSDPAILGFGGWWGGSPGDHPWWTDKSKSGGQFHEQVTHTVDLARYLFGEAVEVYAAAANGFNRDIAGYTMDDAATVAIRFSGGGIANLMSSATSNAGGRVFLDVHSLNHNARFTDWDHSVVLTGKDEEPVEIKGEEDIFAIEDRAFVEAVRSGDRSGLKSTYGDAVKTAAISIAANRSIETGKPVALK